MNKPTREEIGKVINNTRGVAGYLYSSGIEAIISALLSHFDIAEKGKVEKMEKVVEAAREYHTIMHGTFTNIYGCPICKALTELDGKEGEI